MDELHELPPQLPVVIKQENGAKQEHRIKHERDDDGDEDNLAQRRRRAVKVEIDLIKD